MMIGNVFQEFLDEVGRLKRAQPPQFGWCESEGALGQSGSKLPNYPITQLQILLLRPFRFAYGAEQFAQFAGVIQQHIRRNLFERSGR